MKRLGVLVLSGVLLLSGVQCVSSGANVRSAGGSVQTPAQAPVAGPVQMPPMPQDTGFTVPVPVGPIAPPNEIVEPVPGGVIDWGARVVRARGSGVLDPADENLSRARLMAERAAVVVAQRNLLEIIKGVRVDSDTKVENFVTRYDVIYTRVEGVIKGARQTGPARYDSAAGIVEVELEVALDGPQSVADALLPALGPQSGEIRAQVSPAVREFFKQYSGLVLDAGNTGLKPALFPKIYDESGNLLLDTRELYRYTGSTGQTVLNYITRLDEILSRPEFARQPLVLKIKEVRGRLGSDIVISRQDAEKLKWLKDGAKFLLEAGRLIVRLIL
ncbi:MAG: hypothetical protein ABIK51_07015 [candidate division WOR-3 bacterium]